MAVFAMLGALMYASKMIMEVAPNVHLLGVFTIAFTVVYRKKALYPIYTYVLLNGIFCGFATWWIPYLYLWAVLWGATMLLPKRIPEKLRLYAAVCCPWLFIRNFVCTGAGTAVRFKLSENGCLDHQWAALGFRAWCQ